MKKVLILFTLVFAFYSCSSDDNGGDAPGGGSAEFYMYSFINSGAGDYQYKAEGALYCTYTEIIGTMQIQSVYPDGSKGITLSIMNFSGVGAYPITTTGTIAQYYEGETSFTTLGEDYTGSIEITDYNPEKKTIKGKFNFEGKELNGNQMHHLFGGIFKCKGLDMPF